MLEGSVKCNTAFGARMYKLPAVKECLYHPRLPTFRRMDIDTAAHKLPDEHCRTTSSFIKENFNNATVTLYRPPVQPLSCSNVTETGRSLLGGIESPSSPIPRDGALTPTSSPTPQKDCSSTLPFSGYKMRYLSPSVTASWKYCLRQEPFIDHYGQRPVPANIFSRHRTLKSASCVSTSGWRP